MVKDLHTAIKSRPILFTNDTSTVLTHVQNSNLIEVREQTAFQVSHLLPDFLSNKESHQMFPQDHYSGSPQEEYPSHEMIHELRNAVTGILMGLEFMETQWKNMTLLDFMNDLRQIKSQAHTMQKILKYQRDLFTEESILSRMEEMDVTNVVASVINAYKERARLKNITLEFHPLVLNTIIKGEPLALRQILDNLLSNALKFSPSDSRVEVYVVVSCLSAAHTEISTFWEVPLDENDIIRFVRIEIHDSGPGVTHEDKEQLFLPYSKLSAKPTGGEDSTGLGLSIVKKLTDAMGGQVWCESFPEKGEQGSKFILEFPLVKEM